MTSFQQDNYLLAWAVCIGGGEWEPWASSWAGPGRFHEEFGQFNFGGTPYLTRLGKMGVPIVTDALRNAILERVEEWRLEAA
jgi:hypothetical protein